jgi:phosphatidylglycerophosphate synthase
MRRFEQVMSVSTKGISTVRELLRPANILSLIRIPLALIMILLYDNKTVFFVLLALAIISDGLDGYAARKTRPTALGAALDPACDRIFVAILLFFLVFTARLTLLGLGILNMRDVFTTLIFFIFAFSKNKKLFKDKVKARMAGKIVTVSQFIALVWLFLGIGSFSYVLFAVLLLSVAAIIDYLILIKKQLSRH